MCELRPLATLGTSTACNRDIFTLQIVFWLLAKRHLSYTHWQGKTCYVPVGVVVLKQACLWCLSSWNPVNVAAMNVSRTLLYTANLPWTWIYLYLFSLLFYLTTLSLTLYWALISVKHNKYQLTHISLCIIKFIGFTISLHVSAHGAILRRYINNLILLNYAFCMDPYISFPFH
jgi:hypothetical protein